MSDDKRKKPTRAQDGVQPAGLIPVPPPKPLPKEDSEKK